MSPSRRGTVVSGQSFPRVSGDEPRVSADPKNEAVFSPRERG